MAKLLYIGHSINKPTTGGEICCKNNQYVLKSIFSKDFCMYSLLNESFTKICFNKLFLLYPGLQLFDFSKIYSAIRENMPDFVFIETAQYGALVKAIKKKFPHIKIITFFHNIEIAYAKSYFSILNPKSWYFYILTKYNESFSILYSDFCLTINKADSQIMEEIYGRKADCVFPFSIKNTLEKNDLKVLEESKNKIQKHNCLFVGSNFFGNTDGLNWFIENVLPKTEIHLTIVGNGMSKAFSNSDKITVFECVEDLSVFYKEADFVLLPIISGGGMKTKTADALMYGKAIIATPEVFLGYQVDNLHGIYVCNNSEDFVNAIEKIYSDNIYDFNYEIYKRFLENHSIEKTIEHIRNFFIDAEKGAPSC